MKLQGRNLSSGLSGDDVRLLQRFLQQLRFTVPDRERLSGTFGTGTLDAVRRFQTSQQLTVTGIVDESTVAAMNRELARLAAAATTSVVRGRVVNRDGSPVTAGVVRAFDRDLRSEQPLGESRLGTAGSYEIRYSTSQFLRSEKGLADLVLRLFTADGRELFVSEVLFQAEPDLTVDIELDSLEPASEFERYLAELRPVLQSVAVSDLTEADIEFLSDETTLPALHLAWLAVAHRDAQETRVAPEIHYGLLRQGFPSELGRRLLSATATLREALWGAIDRRIIPARIRESVESSLVALSKLRRELPLRGGEGGGRLLGLLSLAELTPVEQGQFLDAYVDHTGDIESFWKSFAPTPLAAKATRLQQVFQLGLATRNNLPLIRELATRQVRSLRDLPRLKREELRQLVRGSREILAAIPPLDAGETDDQKADRLCGDLTDLVDNELPTASLRFQLEQSTDRVHREAARVLSRVPELELRDGDLEGVLRERPDVLAGIEQPERVRRVLRGVQRTVRIAGNASHARSLFAAGLDSAQAIVRRAPAQFAREFGNQLGGEDQALRYHARAQQITGTVLALTANVQQSLAGPKPGVLNSLAGEAVAKWPQFDVLFGKQSLCRCEHCLSVLSPAAYLVDLLEFINPKTGGGAISVLRKRRPDLEHLTLTCDNTGTALPAIDLVNEVLEFQVAHQTLSPDLAGNTGDLTAAELAARPQVVLHAAYQKLAESVFPPSLPYHRPLAVIREHLQLLGTSRRELLELCRPDGPSTLREMAWETLQISELDWRILREESGLPLGRFYGLPDSQSPATVTHCSAETFLKQTGGTFAELEELVATRWLNPANAISLVDTGTPPGCLPSEIVLAPLTPAFWSRAHRLLRLRRIVGWSIPELDLVLSVLQADELHEEVLLRVESLVRLARSTSLAIRQLAAFVGDLETGRPGSLYDQLFLNPGVAGPGQLARFTPGTSENAAATLQEELAAVASALRLERSELDRLLESLQLSGPSVPLTVASLSALYRHAVLARALRLSMDELLAVQAFTGLAPFAPAEPQATVDFIAAVDRIRRSGFSVSEFDFLLRHSESGLDGGGLSGESMWQLLRALQGALTAPGDEFLIPPPDPADRLVPALASAFSLEGALVDRLIRSRDGRPAILKAIEQPAGDLVETFLPVAQAVFPQIVDPAAGFDPPFDSFARGLRRLEKAARAISLLGLGEREVEFLAGQGGSLNGFDWNGFPVDESDPQVAFDVWADVVELIQWQRRFTSPVADLLDVLSAAWDDTVGNPREQAINALQSATGWPIADLEDLAGPAGFDLSEADDFATLDRLRPLLRWLELARRHGVGGRELFETISAPSDAQQADQVVALVQARYSHERWLTVARTINDRLRETSRSALCDYLLAHDPGVQAAKISRRSQLFSHFLIDVEVSACARTSRIKQAISSVQLFIQRCLMNLEPAVDPQSLDAPRWEWTRNYRVWEANRKVFLYPENWIEPTLRDDKSPLFEQLESALLQREITSESSEDLFLNYLEGLDQLARLQPCGLCVDEQTGTLHVFARSETTPRRHYHRRRLGGSVWTPWEPIDLEITGDQLIPVVRNRRLYLFWLNFEEQPDANQQLEHPFIQSAEHWRWLTERLPLWEALHKDWRRDHAEWQRLKQLFELLSLQQNSIENLVLGEEPPEPRRPDEPPFSVPPTLAHWEISLAWSEYRDGAWSPRRQSTDPLFSPRVLQTLQQWFSERNLDLNDYNQEHRLIPNDGIYALRETYFTAHLPAAETHFALVGDLPLAANDGSISVWILRRYQHTERVVLGKSHEFPLAGYDLLGLFRVDCGGKVRTDRLPQPLPQPESSWQSPDGTTNDAMLYRHVAGEPALVFSSGGQQRRILGQAMPRFEILYDNNQRLNLRPPYDPFFYHDSQKTYFAEYGLDQPGGVLRIPSHALVPLFGTGESPLIESIKKRLTAAPARGSRQRGARMKLTARQSPPGGLSSQRSPVAVRGVAPNPLLTGSPLAEWNLSNSVLSQGLTSISGHLPGHLAAARSGLRFESFFHPHVCRWINRLQRDGLPGLLRLSSQQLDNRGPQGSNLFDERYEPGGHVVRPYPRETVDFDDGAYAGYNWELFFHVPMLIATSLCENQRFDEALQWLNFVFDPAADQPQSIPIERRCWKLLPFYRNSDPDHEQIHHLLNTLAGGKPGWKRIQTQIDQWRADPFNPHAIARLRITAYQKHVVMKCLDILLGWGDQLFRRDTLESINEATLLYLLAGEILGPRPETIPPAHPPVAKSYHQIAGELDAFGNALVELENLVPAVPEGSPAVDSAPAAGLVASAAQTLLFCIPANEQLAEYWTTVEDRLFKIRNCQNIDGITRSLPLFEPPIDPALLVRARAAGLDLGSVLNELSAPPPAYRYQILSQKALELCGELKSLAGALLSALEKRDTEALTNLRTSQETALLRLVRDVKQRQVDEAEAALRALRESRRLAETRYNYFRDIEKISLHEKSHLEDLSVADDYNLAAETAQSAAGAAFQFPNLTTGQEGPFTVLTATVGGSTVGAGLQAGASVLRMIGSRFTYRASMASIVGGYARRWEDWKLQERLAAAELDQIDKQLIAAEIRQELAETELRNHERQIEQSQAVEEYLRTKYTREQLYQWMAGQISRVYFQTYTLAFDLAKRTERAWQTELGLAAGDSSFIRFGHWDNLRQGLLAGEQLTLDLKRMDAAYLARPGRDYELTRHVSLQQLDPLALVRLRETGVCDFEIPEWWFDLDCPGHYLRRIKTVSLSIPCVTGPYAGVNCTLTLKGSQIRTKPSPVNPYPRDGIADDRFRDETALNTSVVTGSGQNDSGLFEVSLQGERLLPFESAGAISSWRLQLPANPSQNDPAQFDYHTISDVVLHLRYTAREGEGLLRQAAIAQVKDQIASAQSAGCTRLFSVRHDFPGEWARFIARTPEAGQGRELLLELRPEHYPFWSQGRLNAVTRVDLLARPAADTPPASLQVTNVADPQAPNVLSDTLLADPQLGNLLFGQLQQVPRPAKPVGPLKLYVQDTPLKDLWVAIGWSE